MTTISVPDAAAGSAPISQTRVSGLKVPMDGVALMITAAGMSGSKAITPVASFGPSLATTIV